MAKASVSTKEEVLEAISKMSVMDLVELISEMEEKFGVTAAAPVAVAAAPAAVSYTHLTLPTICSV